MKAQLAILESLIALSIGSAAVSSVVYAAYVHQSEGVQGTVLHNAMFDIVGVTYRNATFGSCIAAWDKTCVAQYLDAFRRVYSLQYASLQYGNRSVATGRLKACERTINYCIPIGGNLTYREVCYVLCGG
jgi:hypothetical protein